MSAFDWGSYHGLVESVFGKFQELYEIDLVLDGCRAIDAFNKPQDNPLDYEAGPGRDYNEQHTIRLGRTYPFDLQVYVYKEPGKIDFRFILSEPDRHDYGFVESAGGEAASWCADIRGHYHDIVSPLLKVDSGSYIDQQRVLLRTAEGLESIRDDFAFLSGSDWDGESADRFFRFFYWPFADLRERHVWGIEQLLLLIAHVKTINDVGQLALMNLLTAADQLLDDQLASRRNLTQDEISRTAAAVGAGVSTVLAGATAKSPKAGGPFTIIAGALSLLTAIPGEADVEVPIFGTRADDIDDVLGDALRELVTNIDDKYTYVAQMASGVSSAVDGLKERIRGTDDDNSVNDWRPIQPGLRVGDDGGFHHQSSGRTS